MNKKTAFDPNTLNKPGEHIMWFDDFSEDNGKPPTNQYRFLSNFYVGAPIIMPGMLWGEQDGEPVLFQTGEHAFAAFKTLNREQWQAIVDAPTPGKAKSLGRTCDLRPDWEVIKLDVMAAVLRCKFTLERAEGTALLKTENALLTEGTYWGDTVWGVDLTKPFWPGRNWLGTLLMSRRAELVAERDRLTKMHTGEHNIGWVLSKT